MASLNTRRKPQLPPQSVAPTLSNVIRTHEGAPALLVSPELALRRSVCSCLLWENTFYEDGEDIAARIVRLAGQVTPKVLADLAYDARTYFNLRHVPLLLCSVLAHTHSGSRLIGDTITDTIQRADEISEFLAVYAKVNGVEPRDVKKKLSAQVKKGLARAFAKFDRYQIAKYFSPSAESGQPIKARDAMFLSHPRPVDDEQAELWKDLIAGKAKSADTWEVALSAGKDKKETFTAQLEGGKLGYLALLRNLRNMVQAGVDQALIERAILARRGARRVLPFRYVAAARACPQMVPAIDQALGQAIAELPSLGGQTVVLVDVSGSMDGKLSDKSDLTRIDAAAALAAIIPGDCRVFTFSEQCVEVSAKRGMAGIEAIRESQPHRGTYLGKAILQLQGGSEHFSLAQTRGSPHVEMDRLIVVSDEQSHDAVPTPTAKHAYLINVAPYRNGVGYGERWMHIDGFSEQALRFIKEYEQIDA
jgi:60 kDa SS-A/Ro ribonucleoprotein